VSTGTVVRSSAEAARLPGEVRASLLAVAGLKNWKVMLLAPGMRGEIGWPGQTGLTLNPPP
jgi:hypothetical protein